MSMVTRCPACATSFRVTVQHLRAREGFVRCGRCSEIFNALVSLSALTSENQAPGLSHANHAPQLSRADHAPQLSHIDQAPQRSHVDHAPQLPRIDHELDGEPAPGADEGFDFLVPRERNGSALWWTATLVAALALALQGVYFFRADIASRFPQTEPYLHAMCAFMGCSLERSSDPRDLSIADSDLRADPQRAEVVILSVVIKNGAEHAKDHPALELTLTDRQDRPLARRVFLPEDYLKKKETAGIAPGAEVPLELVLAVGDLNAAGYRLYLFYP